MDGAKASRMNTKTRRALVQSVVTKALGKNADLLNSTLREMGNGEFFDLVENC